MKAAEAVTKAKKIAAENTKEAEKAKKVGGYPYKKALGKQKEAQRAASARQRSNAVRRRPFHTRARALAHPQS